MNSNNKLFSILLVMAFALSSCFNDLDTTPTDPDVVSSENVFDRPEAYKEFLAKIYAGLASTGQEGPAGQPDIEGIDEGFSNYIRQYWKVQELTTDEAVIAWNDGTIQDYHELDFDEGSEFNSAMYSRIFFQIQLCNEYLRQTTDERLDSRGVSEDLRSEIKFFRAETRFMRALSYFHSLDLYHNPPFVTDEDPIGAFLPEQTNPRDLFNFIESELKTAATNLKDPNTNEYGRVDKAAAWSLLAKLYLNAEVYTGTDHYDDCIIYSDKVINESSYALATNYTDNFVADNHNSPEIIYPVNFDGLMTQGYGGTTFLIHAAIGGSMPASDYGIDSGWGGTRVTSALVNKFPTDSTDTRALFYKDGQNLEIESIPTFTDGYAVNKFTNLTKDGGQASDLTFTDTDFPMLRLAEVYLMYAESVARGGEGGSTDNAVDFVNQLRERAYGNSDGNITSSDLTPEFILDERARELYWECHRRTDLIRFGLLTTDDYLWPWKGGVMDGTSVNDRYNLMPIPRTDLISNPNLKQNDGY